MLKDLIIALIGIAIYLAFIATFRQKHVNPQDIIGRKVLVKSKGKLIETGICRYISRKDNIGECVDSEGEMFYIYIKHVFWSDEDQAYVEKV